MTVAMAGVLLAGLLIGVPLAIAFALPVFIFSDTLGISIDALAGVPYDALLSFPLLAIPLFLLAAEIMRQGGLALLLTQLCDSMLGRVRAAYGYIMIMASALFGSMTGSSLATVAAMGGIVGPEMVVRGYPKGYCAVLGASAGLLGVLLPPSIPLILYGSVVGVSIGKLFLATLVPALVMVCAFALVHMLMSRYVLKNGIETAPEEHQKTPAVQVGGIGVGLVFMRSMPVLLLPVIVLGGIYSGVFTPTEAAAVACVYSLAIVIWRREMGVHVFADCLRSTVIIGGAILVIIALTSIFNRAMVLNEVPQLFAEHLINIIDTKIGFLIAVNVILLVVGMFMETSSAVLLISPLLMPAAVHYGVDPIHFGIIVVTNIEIGLLTPPMAANLFVAAKTGNTTLHAMMRYLLPFLAVAFVVQGFITFVPSLALWYEFI